MKIYTLNNYYEFLDYKNNLSNPSAQCPTFVLRGFGG